MKLPALLHSVSYSGSWGQAFLPLDQFIDKAADLGYDGVMLMAKQPHLSLLDFGLKERVRLRSHIERRKLGFLCLAAYNNFTADLEHAEIPHREIQVHYITELARLASELGAGLIRIFTGYENPALKYTAQWSLIVGAIKECARRAAAFGVTIGVQNHHDIGAGVDSQFDLIRAVDEPNCRALFDAWPPALHGEDLKAAAKRMAPLTVHTTIANYQPRPRYRYDSAAVNYTPLPPFLQAVPVDEGFINYGAFLQAMQKGGFDGSIAYEMCSPLLGGGEIENLDRYAVRFLDFLIQIRQATFSEVKS